MQNILSHLRQAVSKYEMISEGDKIAVGVSGGKDSLLLCKALAELRKFYPVNFTVIAVTVDMHFGGKDGDFENIRRCFEAEGIEYHIEKTELWDIVFKERKEKNPCSLCSRMRKGALYGAAAKYGCNKVALGHHADDAAVSFFMSLLKNGTVSCFSPKTELPEKGVTVIRPFCLTRERDIIHTVKALSLPVTKSGCAFDGCTVRSDVAATVRSLTKEYGDIVEKTVGALSRGGLCGW